MSSSGRELSNELDFLDCTKHLYRTSSLVRARDEDSESIEINDTHLLQENIGDKTDGYRSLNLKYYAETDSVLDKDIDKHVINFEGSD